MWLITWYLKSPWNLDSDEYKFILLLYMVSLITWLIMRWDSHQTIVQLSLFNHVNPWSISSVIAFTKFAIYEIWTSPTFETTFLFSPTVKQHENNCNKHHASRCQLPMITGPDANSVSLQKLYPKLNKPDLPLPSAVLWWPFHHVKNMVLKSKPEPRFNPPGIIWNPPGMT